MELNNVQIALNALALELEEELRLDLKSAGHYESGKLDNSISFSVVKEGDNFRIKMQVMNYIKYLDDGTFWTNFKAKEQKRVKETIQKNIKKDVIAEIKKS